MRYYQNGLASGRMVRVEFDQLGHVIGSFEDGTKRKIYRIPLTKFSNPNGLAMKNGLFAETGGTEGSGPGKRFALQESGIAALTPGAIELSNVDITVEFTQMLAAQQSYNSNATVFKTVDEMTMVARDLKA
jgi:flagellar hook protein FlgE